MCVGCFLGLMNVFDELGLIVIFLVFVMGIEWLIVIDLGLIMKSFCDFWFSIIKLVVDSSKCEYLFGNFSICCLIRLFSEILCNLLVYVSMYSVWLFVENWLDIYCCKLWWNLLWGVLINRLVYCSLFCVWVLFCMFCFVVCVWCCVLWFVVVFGNVSYCIWFRLCINYWWLFGWVVSIMILFYCLWLLFLYCFCCVLVVLCIVRLCLELMIIWFVMVLNLIVFGFKFGMWIIGWLKLFIV